MLRKFDFSFYARGASLFLLFCIPGLYIPILMPALLLPAVSILSIAAGYFFSRLRYRVPILIAANIIALLGLQSFVFFVSGYFHTPQMDEVHLHFGQAFVLILLTALFSGATTILRIRTNRWKYAEPLVAILFLCALFWSQSNHSLTLMNHPVKAALFALFFMLLQILQLANFARAPTRSLIPLAVFIPVLLGGAYFLVRVYNAHSVSNNGGLIQPTMFRFDFSPYLSLQDEIKMNDKLVMIVRTKRENTNTFLRRIYLSGWNPKKGFFEANAPGESAQPKEVPRRKTTFQHPDYALRTPTDQEYFIVNFDPSSLVAMDFPVTVTPYKIWDSSSFSGAYSVSSNSVGFMPFELFDSQPPTDKDLPRETRAFYTNIDDHYRFLLEPTVTKLVARTPGYYDKILALVAFLHDGDYRYSLKPGTAPDGDQLSWFLFNSKKGYCTYYAFSLCLMLRTIGIPSRVAAGFFIRPDSGALDYYPIRANMAHAWVEVFFPKYGWISFDPTTTQVAEGEDLAFSNNPGGDEFMNLLNEIIGNRALLTPEDSHLLPADSLNPIQKFAAEILKMAKRHWGLLLAAMLLSAAAIATLIHILARSKKRSPRERILSAAAAMYRTLRRHGKKPSKSQSRKDFIVALGSLDAKELYELEQKARFAPFCDDNDAARAEELASVLKKKKRLSFFILFLIPLLVFCEPGQLNAENTQNSTTAQASELLARAQNAILAENWENAISILSEGITKYPSTPDFRKALGTLYLDQGLYESAYKELQKALSLGYANPIIYSNLSDAASYLNRDEESLGYLKKFLDSSPNDLFAWSNYGWLCYKTHRINEGIKALQHIAETYGPDGNLYVGLANLYTAAFDYANAKKYYTLAINIAVERHQPYLSSIYYYNRSILEEIFYNFSDAYDDTVLSLQQSPRSSGYLMQGELELRKLDFRKAFAQYLKAYSLDSTPLAAIGLADTLLQSGHATEALRYIKAIRSKNDLSWIANYGTTPNQYLADFGKIQRDFYIVQKNKEKRKIVHNLSTWLSSLQNNILNSLSFWYHDTFFRIQNTRVARHYAQANTAQPPLKGQKLFINSYYFLAFDKWKQTALPYLEKADQLETEYIPAAKPSYLYEKGKLTHNAGLINESIRTLDPLWEREILTKALAERIKLTKKLSSVQRIQDCLRLFDLNPASFIYYDINLPVSLETRITNDKKDFKDSRQLSAMLKQAGFQPVDASPLLITILETDTNISVALTNKNNNATIYTQTIHRTAGYQQELPGFINKFSTNIFSIDLGLAALP
jgi:Transglutaminase-like enzymes, putative cysteine proteases